MPSTPNVAEMLWNTAARAGDQPAVVTRDRLTDYRTLQERAAALAGALHAGGTRPGDRVGILLDGGADAVAAFFAVAAVGAIAIVINESLRPRQIEHMLGSAAAQALLTSDALLARQPRPIDTTAVLLRVEHTPERASYDPVARHGSDPAQICYTSGSTGQPKGVTISHANLWHVMRAVTEYLKIA